MRKVSLLVVTLVLTCTASEVRAVILTAVGGNGTILRSTDSGQTWTPQASNTTLQLNDVDFVDALTGWTVGDIPSRTTGTVRKTINGGASWQTVSLPYRPGNLNGVRFVNPLEGWIANSLGSILHSTDGGNTWTVQATGEGTSDFFDLDFVDTNNGWAVGTGGLIMNTTDGGATWGIQRKEGGIVFGVDFVDANTGWTVGQSGSIRHTTDGGATWSSQTSGVPADLRDIVFVDATNGWAVGAAGPGGVIIHTSDGGTTWQTQATDSSNLFAIDFTSQSLGWAVGENGTILHTADGGLTWATQTSGTVQSLLGIAAIADEDPNVIPEPTTLVIWSLLATLGLSFYRRRRRRAI